MASASTFTVEAAESSQANRKAPFGIQSPARLCFLWLSAAVYYAMDAAHATWKNISLATTSGSVRCMGCACCEILTRTSATYSQSENATSLLQRHLPAEVDSRLLSACELKLPCMRGGLGGSAFPPWTTSFFESSPGVLAFHLLIRLSRLEPWVDVA